MAILHSEPLKIKRRGEDGTKVLTIRVPERIITELDCIAKEAHYSRNELITIMLEHGIKVIEIE